MKLGKADYIKFKQDHLPVWCNAWYLDAVCGDAWDCRFVVNEGKILAVWVYGERIKWGLRSINFPTFLKYNGLFFDEEVKIEQRDEMGLKLLMELPRRVKMSVEFMSGVEHEVPSVMSALEARAFAQKERTTYIWEIGRGREELLKGMDGNYRRMINKQKDGCELRSETRTGAMELYEFHREWVGDLREYGVSQKEYERLIGVLYDRGTGEVMSLYKEEAKIASVLLLRDGKTVYYLLAVNNKDYNKIYPSVLMADAVMSYVSEKGVLRVDFLGSDIEAISRVWRKLGAKKLHYIYMNKSIKFPF